SSGTPPPPPPAGRRDRPPLGRWVARVLTAPPVPTRRDHLADAGDLLVAQRIQREHRRPHPRPVPVAQTHRPPPPGGRACRAPAHAAHPPRWCGRGRCRRVGRPSVPRPATRLRG